MPLEVLPAFILASALLALAPGPDNLFVLTQSALYGRQAGLSITLGLCTGLLIHTLAVALGVAALFRASVLAFTLLKFAGAAYLLYLAWSAWRSSRQSLDVKQSSLVPRPGALYRRGILMNLGNPKVAIFFLAFLPQFAQPEAGPLTPQLILLGLTFILVAWSLFSLIALLAGSIAHYLRDSPWAQRLMQKIAALVLASLALRLAFASQK